MGRRGRQFESARPDFVKVLALVLASAALVSATGASAETTSFRGTISRIDRETDDVETISIGNAPAGIAVADGLVWVTVQEP